MNIFVQIDHKLQTVIVVMYERFSVCEVNHEWGWRPCNNVYKGWSCQINGIRVESADLSRHRLGSHWGCCCQIYSATLMSWYSSLLITVNDFWLKANPSSPSWTPPLLGVALLSHHLMIIRAKSMIERLPIREKLKAKSNIFWWRLSWSAGDSAFSKK